MHDPLSLSGRIAIVTGASSGIGEAIAHALLQEGAEVFSLSRRQASVGIPIVCDVSNTESVDRAVASVIARAGRLDVLVNAAGQSLSAADEVDELQRFRRTLEVNLVGAYACCLAGRDALVESSGSIVNVTSINASQGFPGNPGYVAAKTALAGLTRSLAVDLGQHGVRVNAVAPGYVRTAMTEVSHADVERRRARSMHTVLGRWGEVSEIAQAVTFLASPRAAYVTGQELVVDGGWTIKGLIDLGGNARAGA